MGLFKYSMYEVEIKVWAKVQIALEKAHTDFSSEISMLHVVSLQYMILIYENKPLKAFQYVKKKILEF